MGNRPVRLTGARSVTAVFSNPTRSPDTGRHDPLTVRGFWPFVGEVLLASRPVSRPAPWYRRGPCDHPDVHCARTNVVVALVCVRRRQRSGHPRMANVSMSHGEGCETRHRHAHTDGRGSRCHSSFAPRYRPARPIAETGKNLRHRPSRPRSRGSDCSCLATSGSRDATTSRRGHG